MTDERRKCPACGSNNPAHALWCGRCHARFTEVAPPPPPAPGVVPIFAGAAPAPAPPVGSTSGMSVPRLSLDGLSPGARRAIKIGLRVLPVLFLVMWLNGRAQVSILDRMGLGRPQPVEGTLDPRGFKPLLADPETNDPVRYGCAPVAYTINPAHAPEGGLDDVHRAIAETSRASGVQFAYEGETGEVPAEKRDLVQRDRYGDRWAPILVAWDLGPPAVPGQVSPVGAGGSEWRYNEAGDAVYVTGVLILNASADLRSGFGGETWGQVMLHEFGHVMGLAHVSDPKQVMTPILELRPAAWGTGDRAGLRELGIGSPCLDVPTVS